jgi:hypothetical protein
MLRGGRAPPPGDRSRSARCSGPFAGSSAAVCVSASSRAAVAGRLGLCLASDVQKIRVKRTRKFHNRQGFRSVVVIAKVG